jgi:hypothetical protein
MALISCPECKKEISDKSEHCIECGAPQHVILGDIKEKIDSEQKEYKVEIDNSKSKKVNNTNILKRFFNLEKKQIYLICFILWPLTCAFGITINDYMLELTYGNVNQFGKIPADSVMKGIMAGLFSGGILLGVSYFINFLFSLFINSSKLTAPKVFLVITILWTALTIYGYGGKFIKVLNLEKENVEYINEEIKRLKQSN